MSSREVRRARQLRRDMTEAERLLWHRLRRKQLHGARFRRQHPIGPFIVDFVCVEAKLVIEVDGGQHALAESADAARTRWLNTCGFRVLRFWNNQVREELEAVIEVIAAAIPSPSP